MEKRNNNIALFKFIYSWIIVFFHFFPTDSGKFIGGYIGVEYYLLVAGVFFFVGYERQSAQTMQTPYAWFVKRFWRLFPWAFTAFLFSAIVIRGIPTSFVQALDYFSGDIWEILLIKWNGMNDGQLLINGPAWTMSSMLLAGFFIWGFLYFLPEKFLNFFMPISIIVGYGIWRHVESAGTEVWIGFTTFGTFRTYIVMCLGYYCLKLSQKLSGSNLNARGKALITIIEVLCQVLAIAIMLKRGTRNYQWFATLLLFVAIAIAISGKSMLTDLLNRFDGVYFLQNLSLSVYLMHFGAIRLFETLYGYDYNRNYYFAFLIALILLLSLLHYFVTKFLIKKCGKVWGIVKSKIIDN